MTRESQFQALFDAHNPALESIVQRNKDVTCKDALQTLWLELWQQRVYKRGKNVGRTLLDVVAALSADEQLRFLKRVLWTRLLNEKRTIHYNSNDPTLMLSRTIERQSASDFRRYVHELLEDLPRNEQRLARKAWIQGFSQTEIAESLGVSQFTVSKRLQSIKDKLRLFNWELFGECHVASRRNII